MIASLAKLVSCCVALLCRASNVVSICEFLECVYAYIANVEGMPFNSKSVFVVGCVVSVYVSRYDCVGAC